MNLIGFKVEDFKSPVLVGSHFEELTAKDLEGKW